MDDEALFHRIWLEFRVRRSDEIRQELRNRTLDRSFGARMRTLRGLLARIQATDSAMDETLMNTVPLMSLSLVLCRTASPHRGN